MKDPSPYRVPPLQDACRVDIGKRNDIRPWRTLKAVERKGPRSALAHLVTWPPGIGPECVNAFQVEFEEEPGMMSPDGVLDRG
jgi:hypothetical protein